MDWLLERVYRPFSCLNVLERADTLNNSGFRYYVRLRGSGNHHKPPNQLTQQVGSFKIFKPHEPGNNVYFSFQKEEPSIVHKDTENINTAYCNNWEYT